MNYVLGILRLCKVKFSNRSTPLIITDEKKTEIIYRYVDY